MVFSVFSGVAPVVVFFHRLFCLKFTHKKNSLAVDVLQEGVAISEFSFNLVEEVFKSNLHLPAVAVAHVGIPCLGGIFAIDLVH